MDFLIKNKDIMFLILGAILVKIIPRAKLYFLGGKVADKISKDLAITIADRIDAFEQGLRKSEHYGNKNIISNSQLETETKKLKIDLGLEK